MPRPWTRTGRYTWTRPQDKARLSFTPGTLPCLALPDGRLFDVEGNGDMEDLLESIHAVFPPVLPPDHALGVEVDTAIRA